MFNDKMYTDFLLQEVLLDSLFTNFCLLDYITFYVLSIFRVIVLLFININLFQRRFSKQPQTAHLSITMKGFLNIFCSNLVPLQLARWVTTTLASSRERNERLLLGDPPPEPGLPRVRLSQDPPCESHAAATLGPGRPRIVFDQCRL